MADKIQTKKQFSTQLTTQEEREQLRKDIEAWKKEKAETLKNIEEHYKNNPGGGMYYRWFDDDCYHMEEMFRERALKILKREAREEEQRIQKKLQEEKLNQQKQ